MTPLNDTAQIPGGISPDVQSEFRVLARETLFPWQQMDAQPIPDVYLDAIAQIMLTISTMVMQTPNGPQFIQGDVLGRMSTAAAPYYTDALIASGNLGDLTIQVATPSLYAPGIGVILAEQGPGNVGTVTDVRRVKSVSGSTVTLDAPLAGSVANNARVLVMSYIDTPRGATRVRTYDFIAHNRSAPAGKATCQVAVIPGQLVVVAYVMGSLLTTAATANAVTLQLSGDLTVVTGWPMATPAAANSVDRVEEQNLAIPVSANNQVALGFDVAGGAGTTQEVAMGGYILDLAGN